MFETADKMYKLSCRSKKRARKRSIKVIFEKIKWAAKDSETKVTFGYNRFPFFTTLKDYENLLCRYGYIVKEIPGFGVDVCFNKKENDNDNC